MNAPLLHKFFYSHFSTTLPGLVLLVSILVSCAGNGDPLVNPESKNDGTPTAASGNTARDYYSYDESSTTPATSSNQDPENRSASATALDSKGYRFKNPGGDWSMIGGEDGAPYEFYNARTGRRAVLREVTLTEGEPMNLMDRARIEMQSYESSTS